MKKTRILSALLLVAVLCGALSSCALLFGPAKPWEEGKLTDTFFDADYLAELSISDLPSPKLDGSYFDPDKNILYLNLSREEFDAYSNAIADYLRGKEEFPVRGFHCGIHHQSLMIIPMNEYQFASLDAESLSHYNNDGHLYAFSRIPLSQLYDGSADIKNPKFIQLKWNPTTKSSGAEYTAEMSFPSYRAEFLSCYHGHDFDEVTYPVPGTVLTTTIRTCERCGKEEREGYGYGRELDKFSYTVISGREHLVSGMHASHWRGSLVEIALKAPESSDLKMTAAGTEIPKVKEVDGQWIYAFIMPYGNIEITIEAVEHVHTGRWGSGEESHWYEYTCGCETKDIAELHYDHDNNGLCDACAYMVGVKQYYSLMINEPEWLYEELKHTYYEGETISVKISMVTDTGFLFFVNGEEISEYQYDSGLYWEFTFTMPACDTIIHFKTYDGFLPDWNYAVLIETFYRQNLDASAYVQHYYGEFASGAIVAMLNISGYNYGATEWEEEVGGSVISYKDGNRIVALCPNNKFYTLTEAFDEGYLTAEDIAAIAEMHNNQIN